MNHKKKKKGKLKRFFTLKKYNIRWVINITFVTFILAIVMSLSSEVLLRNTEINVAFFILIIIILIGVIFDLIGISVATARIEPFNAMASNRIEAAKHAIKLIKNAGPVSNFCNDVIGDISGIVSGATGAIIVIQINSLYPNINLGILSIVLSGFVAALTVGGKALGKEIALQKSKEIVYFVSKILYWINKKLNIEIIPDKKRVSRNRKQKRKVS